MVVHRLVAHYGIDYGAGETHGDQREYDDRQV